MTVSPFAGKPAEASMLVNVPRLVTAYYTEAANPSVPKRGEGRASSVLPQERVREAKEEWRNEGNSH
jgi:hypothetical protein